MKQELTVFICSTFTDFVDEREAILDATRKLQLRHDSMEFFGARPGLPLETCLAEVRKSNILVVVVGHRYGSIVSNLGISFSEAEYEEGFRLGKPCLVYMLDENVPVLPKYIERNPEKIQKLEHWKSLLQNRHTVAMFRDSQDLAVRVTADLARTVKTIEESEEVRATYNVLKDSDIGDILSEIETLGISRERALSIFRQSLRTAAVNRCAQNPKVFFSHSHADKELVHDLADRLSEKNIEVWLDNEKIQVGDSLVQTIEHGLDSSDFIVFFISRNSLKSKWAKQEFNIALTRQITGEGSAVLLPILLEDVELPELPPILRSVSYLDMRAGNTEQAAQMLVKAIQQKWNKSYAINIGGQNLRTSNFRAFINLNFKSGEVGEQVKQLLLEIPEVVEVTLTYGSVDMVVVLAAIQLQRLNEIVEKLRNIQGVEMKNTLIGAS